MGGNVSESTVATGIAAGLITSGSLYLLGPNPCVDVDAVGGPTVATGNDDTAAIVAAYAAGLVVRFSAGKTYKFTSFTPPTGSVTLAYGATLQHIANSGHPITLTGEFTRWFGGTVIADAADTATELVYVTSAMRCRMDDLTLKCASIVPYGMQLYGRSGAGVYYNQFRGIRVWNNAANLIKIDGWSSGSYVAQNSFDYLGGDTVSGSEGAAGPYLSGSKQNVFIGLDVEGMTGYGLDFSGGNNDQNKFLSAWIESNNGGSSAEQVNTGGTGNGPHNEFDGVCSNLSDAGLLSTAIWTRSRFGNLPELGSRQQLGENVNTFVSRGTNWTLSAASYVRNIIANIGASGFIALPTANTVPAGKEFVIKNINANALTVQLATSTDALDGTVNGTMSLAQYASQRFVTDGSSNWYKIG
ncbi:MAG: hypothetical protein KGL39_05455 [Patescibacteria group bacterium]|nr:hypothetical protein [Patescibacteria group bacterium]